MPNKPPYDFQRYGVGNKLYGFGRNAPNMGMVDKLGYREREAKNKMKRNALLRRIKAGLSKNYMSSNWLGGPHT